jgi:hypothetical protein
MGRAISSIPVAVRVYPDTRNEDAHVRKNRIWRLPRARLVIDTETRTDATQRLTFGSYRFIVDGTCWEEGLFYANDLSRKERRVLEKYVDKENKRRKRVGRHLQLLPLKTFLKRFCNAAYRGRCLVIGFNLPFDLSRIAFDWKPARGRFAGGFSYIFWTYIDKRGVERPNNFRPRIAIKHIDSKRALKGFTARNRPDQSDLIPDESESRKPQKGYTFRGHFLDLRTLAFALTDRSYSLQSACVAFGVEHPKTKVSRHGEITPKYIDYNRRDVLATAELGDVLIREFQKHPISLQPTRAYSPASIGKAYLRSMGIQPVLERQPQFPEEYLGYAQSAFFGGRTSAHIRKVLVPVVYVDFLSMYPTVNSLMGLWRFVIARDIRVIKHRAAEVERFLRTMTPDRLFAPSTWKRLNGFVRIIPNGDILPSRARYSAESNDWQVALNHLYAANDNPDDALWFSLPDVVASVLLTGKVPKIVDAFYIEPRGIQKGLKPVKLQGGITVDPCRQDFFKTVIEERKRLSSRTGLSESDTERLDKSHKVLANSTSYGIYAEMNRQELEREIEVKCHGIDKGPFDCRVRHPDIPGEFCFPPLASLITGAARLMLASLEHCVSKANGTYAMEDTDSMAIVATRSGGLVPCPGGPFSMRDGTEAVRALSWQQVRDLVNRFAKLNPYDHRVVPGSILKIEDDNFDPKTGAQRQIHCLAISAKRYALCLCDRRSRPVLLREGVNNKQDRWSEHGLGHLLNPTDPESDDRAWTSMVWNKIVQESVGGRVIDLRFGHLPAIGRTTISSPAVIRPLANLNKGKSYPNQIKPSNFLLTCHTGPFGAPPGVNPERFHLIAPYDPVPSHWPGMTWINQYSGKEFGITTAGHHGRRGMARVKTYGDVLAEYEIHPESKCAGSDGRVCGKQTIGLLQRRHVRVDDLQYIGKESNSIDAVESGLVHARENVYTEYVDTRRDEWQTKTLPKLKRAPLALLVRKSGLSRRMLIESRAGRSRPHPKNQKSLANTLRAIERESART